MLKIVDKTGKVCILESRSAVTLCVWDILDILAYFPLQIYSFSHKYDEKTLYITRAELGLRTLTH